MSRVHYRFIPVFIWTGTTLVAWVRYFASLRVPFPPSPLLLSLRLLCIYAGRVFYCHWLQLKSSFVPTSSLCCPSPLPSALLWCLGLSYRRSSLQHLIFWIWYYNVHICFCNCYVYSHLVFPLSDQLWWAPKCHWSVCMGSVETRFRPHNVVRLDSHAGLKEKKILFVFLTNFV